MQMDILGPLQETTWDEELGIGGNSYLLVLQDVFSNGLWDFL